MAKTIKFNLICDGKPVRTIEDLQNNFSIEDVLAYYNNQLLHRWLKVRGYDKELEDVSAITCTKALDVIKELIRIFEVDTDEERVERSIYSLAFQQERNGLVSYYNQCGYRATRIIDDYRSRYNSLVAEILNNPEDAALIKANISEIATHYEWVLSLNCRYLLYQFREHSPLAVMCLLMHEKTRRYYLPSSISDAVGGDIPGSINNSILVRDKRAMYEDIKRLIARPDFEKSLGNHLNTFSGETNSYWKDFVSADKKVMVISISKGDYVRAYNQIGGDLCYEDIKDSFVILDGLDYKSTSSDHKLRYMEV